MGKGGETFLTPNMSKVLIIAEKSSVATDIANCLLEKKGRKKGYFLGQHFYITWFSGHLLTLSQPQDYDERYKKWNLEDLPIIPSKFKYKIREIKGKKDPKAEEQLKVIKQLMNSDDVSEIICATDPGAEGEYIFREVYYYFRCKKPVKRLWLKSLTENGIKSAFSNMMPMESYDNLYQSAKCRSEADWVTGMNLSRAYSVSLQGQYSIGRVQTPTLAMIVKREIEIQEFVPVSFCTLKANYGAFAAAYFLPEREDGYPLEWIMDKTEAQRVKELIVGQQATLEALDKKEVFEKPPLLYDLDSLRVDCSSQFGLTAEETLKIVQFLYERKLVSYPRTDSCYLSSKDVPELGNVLAALYDHYSTYVKQIRDKNYCIRPDFIDDEKVTEHSALIPTEKALCGSLSEIQQKVYDLIARRFISAFMPNYEATSINAILSYPELNIPGKFHTSGRVTRVLGWRAVYGDEEDETNIAALEEGSKFDTLSGTIEEKRSRPPSRYTDGSIIEAMKTAGKHVEDPEAKALMKGIGTPATRSGIIERLIAVGYVQRVGKILYPTPKGMEIISLIKDEVLKSPELTGEWEKKRYLIEKGSYDPDVFMREIASLVKSIICRMKGEEYTEELENSIVEKEITKEKAENKVKVKEDNQPKKYRTLEIKIQRDNIQSTDKKEVILNISKNRAINKNKTSKIILMHGKRQGLI